MRTTNASRMRAGQSAILHDRAEDALQHPSGKWSPRIPARGEACHIEADVARRDAYAMVGLLRATTQATTSPLPCATTLQGHSPIISDDDTTHTPLSRGYRRQPHCRLVTRIVCDPQVGGDGEGRPGRVGGGVDDPWRQRVELEQRNTVSRGIGSRICP